MEAEFHALCHLIANLTESQLKVAMNFCMLRTRLHWPKYREMMLVDISVKSNLILKTRLTT